MPKDRRIEDISPRLGDFLDLIKQRIESKGKVRILDAGCGYGTAMVGFVKRFGNLVDIIGFNYSEYDGNLEIMTEDAIKKGIFTEEELKEITNLPRFIYCDASKRLPFDSNSFDFIYGMNSLHYYDDKIHFLEECNRILTTEGIARITSAFGNHYPTLRKSHPEKYPEFWEIWDDGKEVKIWDYCNKIKGVKAVWDSTNPHEYWPQYIEIKKQPKLDFGLKLVASIDFNFLWEGYSGVKSIYTTQLKFEPKWKK